jgi:serine/threonine-protein phosphatase 4 regulatory subunit 1
MAPLLGRSSTEQLFLNRFAALCTDPVFYVRKACASNFGEFCAIIGTDSTESVLVSSIWCLSAVWYIVWMAEGQEACWNIYVVFCKIVRCGASDTQTGSVWEWNFYICVTHTIVLLQNLIKCIPANTTPYLLLKHTTLSTCFG